MDVEGPARSRAARLEALARRERTTALALDALADAVERRLEPVTAVIESMTWTGRAASVARRAAAEAGEDLRLAARSLRELAEELRASAASLDWRAEALSPPPVAPWSGPPDGPEPTRAREGGR